jgi:putative aminopeptidase FrvX
VSIGDGPTWIGGTVGRGVSIEDILSPRVFIGLNLGPKAVAAMKDSGDLDPEIAAELIALMERTDTTPEDLIRFLQRIARDRKMEPSGETLKRVKPDAPS